MEYYTQAATKGKLSSTRVRQLGNYVERIGCVINEGS
jgi:hypothetical protein